MAQSQSMVEIVRAMAQVVKALVFKAQVNTVLVTVQVHPAQAHQAQVLIMAQAHQAQALVTAQAHQALATVQAHPAQALVTAQVHQALALVTAQAHQAQALVMAQAHQAQALVTAQAHQAQALLATMFVVDRAAEVSLMLPVGRYPAVLMLFSYTLH